MVALCEVPGPAGGAVTAGDGRSDDDAVPDAEVAYVRAEFFDNTDALVP
jgi:hypothetical protein